MHLLAVGQIRGVHRDAVAQLAIRHRLHRTGKFMAVDGQRHHIVHARIAAHGAGHSGGQLLAFRRINDVINGDLMNGDIRSRRVIHADRMFCRGSGGVTCVIRCRDTRMYLLAVGQIRGVHRDAVAQQAVRHRLYGAGKFMAVDGQRHHIMHARIAAHRACHSGGQLLAFRRIDDVINGNLMNGDIGSGHIVEANTVIRRGGRGVTGIIRCRDTRMHLLTVGQIRGVHRDAVAQMAIRHRLHRAGKFMAVDRQRHHIMHARIAAHGAGHSGGQLLAFRRIEDVVTGNLMNGDISGGHIVEADTVIRRGGRGVTCVIRCRNTRMHLLAVRQVRSVHIYRVTQMAIRHRLHRAGELMPIHRQRHHIVHPRVAAHGAGHGGG